MPNGTLSSLSIAPRGQTEIILDVTGAGPYLVDLGTLNLNEPQRIQFVYAQQGAAGGAVAGTTTPLVPVAFRCIIRADSPTERIQLYTALVRALANPRGGYLKYKPEGAAVGAMVTYFHYVQSPPPSLMQLPGNRWDTEAQQDGKYYLVIDVEMQTFPLATSNPAAPVKLADDTLGNWPSVTVSGHGYVNYVNIDGDTILGVTPALVRLLVSPSATSGQALGRLMAYRRTDGTLNDFVSLLETDTFDPIYPCASWKFVSNSKRGGGGYIRCLPPEDDNGVEQGFSKPFTCTGLTQNGRFAIFAIAYDASPATGLWTIRAEIKFGDVVQVGREFEATEVFSWHYVYLGEFDIPPVTLSDLEDAYETGPTVCIYATRASGDSEFRVDGLFLVYVQDNDKRDTAIDAPCDENDGVLTTESLLLENYLDEFGRARELSHVVATDGDFKRPTMEAPRGEFLTLIPHTDHKIIMMTERANSVRFEDDFESYIGSHVLALHKDETMVERSLTAGVTTADETTTVEEGAKANKITWTAPWTGSDKTGYVELEFSPLLNLINDPRALDTSFLVAGRNYNVKAGVSVTPSETIRVKLEDSNGDAMYMELNESLDAGWQNVFQLLGSLDGDTIDWTAVKYMLVGGIINGATIQPVLITDYIRIETADPDDANNPNATGNAWDLQPAGGAWTITEDVAGAGATLACLNPYQIEAESEALIAATSGFTGDFKFRARCRAHKLAGNIGLVWKAGDDTLTAGTEDCYAVLIETIDDAIELMRFDNGSRVILGTASMTIDVDTWYVVGVIMKDTTFKVYVAPLASLTDDDDVFSDTYLKFTVTDATYTYGYCGVISQYTSGRFDEVKVTNLSDMHLPGDLIDVEVWAVFTTPHPFYE